MPPSFVPKKYPTLLSFGDNLSLSAGDVAYRAGRDYLRKGMLKEGTVSGTLARAVVVGSVDYQVSISFPSDKEPEVTCTCPAHRRKPQCKHVVAVVVALLEQPKLFKTFAEVVIPLGAPSRRRRRDGLAQQRAAALKLEQRRTGLALVDRVLEELAAGGVTALGKEQRSLLANAAETIRACKLRRLGNLLLALLHFASESSIDSAEPGEFASLLADLYMTQQAVRAHLDGNSELDPALADSLLGKSWRRSELKPVAGLELLCIAEEHSDDGEFLVQSTYLFDLPTGELYVERQITPKGLRPDPKPNRRTRIIVDECGLYPGNAPRRIRIFASRPAPLTQDHVDRVVELADTSVCCIRERLINQLAKPLASTEIAVLFRPAALVEMGDRVAAVDGGGIRLPIAFPSAWSNDAAAVLPEDTNRFAIVGMAGIGKDGPIVRCMSIIGDLRWANGPTYPGMS